MRLFRKRAEAGPHRLAGRVPTNKGGAAFTERYVWTCTCGAHSRGGVLTRYDAETLYDRHRLNADRRTPHEGKVSVAYPPAEGWF